MRRIAAENLGVELGHLFLRRPLTVLYDMCSIRVMSHHSQPTRVRDAHAVVYRSGNSKVITIPSHFPVEVGEQFQLQYENKNIRLKPKEPALKLDRYLGHAPGSTRNKSPEKLENFLEGIYE